MLDSMVVELTGALCRELLTVYVLLIIAPHGALGPAGSFLEDVVRLAQGSLRQYSEERLRGIKPRVV